MAVLEKIGAGLVAEEVFRHGQGIPAGQPAEEPRVPGAVKPTIFALSSGRPPAAVAIIRLSGPGVRFGLETMAGGAPEPRQASLRTLRDDEGQVLDRAVVLFWPGPGSFTGDDVAEFQIHGGLAVVGAVLRTLGRLNGFRLAEAGEFTRRAFENGRMDLTEVEGLGDLIAAQTDGQRRAAMERAQGAVRARCEAWRSELMTARALVEALIDFGEDEHLSIDGGAALSQVGKVRAEMMRELARRDGEIIRDGFTVVIAGPPNAGKSSLLNALARRDVAIVSDRPGTTRDVLEVQLDLGGQLVRLVDTAGLRVSRSDVEGEGIRRARERLERADLVLWLGDARRALAADAGLDRPVWLVGTKADLLDSDKKRQEALGRVDLLISVVNGDGLSDLTGRLSAAARKSTEYNDITVITGQRHRVILERCVSILSDIDAVDSSQVEVKAEYLRRACDEIGALTGRTGVEDMLDDVFGRFCIGK
jgi:tRNA modification GTPase